MNPEQMREKLIGLAGGKYGPGWKLRVQSMSDNQVIAVYYHMKEKGIFNEKSAKSTSEQMTINDILGTSQKLHNV